MCLYGWPRWLALYDLASTAAVETPEYSAVSGPNSTPWSRRVLPRTLGRSRVVAEQVAPGAVLTRHPKEVARLLLVRFADLEPAQERAVAEALAGAAAEDLLQVRLFRSPAPTGADLWAVVEFDGPAAAEPLIARYGRVAGIGARLLNLYTPYDRGG